MRLLPAFSAHEIAYARAEHREFLLQGAEPCCSSCAKAWPCDTARWIATVDAAVELEPLGSCDVCERVFPESDLFNAAGGGLVCSKCRSGE